MLSLTLVNFPMSAIALMLAIVFVSAAGHGTIGFGFPLVATALLALLVDVRTAILITLFPTILVNILSILRGGGWRESLGRFWPLAVYVVLGSALGTKLLIVIDPAPFKLLLAFVTLVYLNLDRLGARRFQLAERAPRLAMALFGLIAGFLAGTVNVMVPVLVIYSMGLGLAPTAMVQVFNFCFLAGKSSQVGVFANAGALDLSSLLSVLPLVVAAVLGVLVGMALRDRISEAFYRHLLQKTLYVISAVLIVQYLTEI